MPALSQLEKTIRYIKRKGFTHVKVELEAQLNRNAGSDYDEEEESCPDCYDGYTDCDHDRDCLTCNMLGRVCEISGSPANACEAALHASDGPCRAVMCMECYGGGRLDCPEDHRCETCDGRGWVEVDRSETPMSDDYCQAWILNAISKEARESVVFSRFYWDGSVDSEFTFTIPVEAIGYLPEFVRAFKSLSEETEYMSVDRAGMHISIMMDGEYPVRNKALDNAKVNNFKKEMTKLLPALFFLASADHHSRELEYRIPRVYETKYSAINIFRGGMEYRVFETCYQRPDMILQFMDIIAKTLKFYGTAQVKKQIFKQFTFRECPSSNRAYVSRFFQTDDEIAALDAGLEYLRPDNVTVEQLKIQRNFKPKFNKIYREAKLRKQYIEFCSKERERMDKAFQKALNKYMIKNNPSFAPLAELYDLRMDKDKLGVLYKRLRQEYEFNPMPYQEWVKNYNPDANIRYSGQTVTIN